MVALSANTQPSARVVRKSNGRTLRVRYYGRRKAEKFARCYQKKQVKAYRAELELHSGLLRREGIKTIDDLARLPELIIPKHFRFVDFDWEHFERYLRSTARPLSLLARAQRHRESVHQLMRYLRNKGVFNPHRFLCTHPINKKVLRALDRWEEEFFSEVDVERSIRKKNKETKRLCVKAVKLLRSHYFFFRLLQALSSVGLVGERRNALVLFIVVVSRLLDRPLAAFVKGASSAGKNWLVRCVLALMLKRRVTEFTSASDKAFHYSGSNLRHHVVFLHEKNDAAGGVHPMRILLSEGKVVHLVVRWIKGKLVTQKHIARGPVAAISTTTKNRVQVDEETRHVSLWVSEHEDQTREIAKAYTEHDPKRKRRECRLWREIHRLLETRIGIEILFPKWFKRVPELLFVRDLRVRRYYPAFVEALRTVCLIRSFLPHRKFTKGRPLELEFVDFAITALIFDEVFVESLHRQDGPEEQTRRLVEEISTRKNRPVSVKDIVRRLGISKDRAYAQLRRALDAGLLRRANEPEKSNRKRYLPARRPRFVPDPEKLFQELKELGSEISFVHPLTGEWVVYRRKK